MEGKKSDAARQRMLCITSATDEWQLCHCAPREEEEEEEEYVGQEERKRRRNQKRSGLQ